MLRCVIGDDKFFATLKDFAAKNAWKPVTTDDFKKAAETVSAQNLGYFFIQWIESSGAPEFKLEYTIFRTQKGFRAMGKIAQDLDTFRMPVDLKIETEGNPEEKRVEVMGTSSEFTVDTFGKPKSIMLDPDNRVLRFSNQMRDGGGDPARRAVRRDQRIRRCVEGIPEGARNQSERLAGPLPHRRGLLPAEQLPVGRQRIPRSAATGIWSRSGPKSGRTSTSARSSISPASASAR